MRVAFVLFFCFFGLLMAAQPTPSEIDIELAKGMQKQIELSINCTTKSDAKSAEACAKLIAQQAKNEEDAKNLNKIARTNTGAQDEMVQPLNGGVVTPAQEELHNMAYPDFIVTGKQVLKEIFPKTYNAFETGIGLPGKISNTYSKTVGVLGQVKDKIVEKTDPIVKSIFNTPPANTTEVPEAKPDPSQNNSSIGLSPEEKFNSQLLNAQYENDLRETEKKSNPQINSEPTEHNNYNFQDDIVKPDASLSNTGNTGLEVNTKELLPNELQKNNPFAPTGVGKVDANGNYQDSRDAKNQSSNPYVPNTIEKLDEKDNSLQTIPELHQNTYTPPFEVSNSDFSEQQLEQEMADFEAKMRAACLDATNYLGVDASICDNLETYIEQGKNDIRNQYAGKTPTTAPATGGYQGESFSGGIGTIDANGKKTITSDPK